MFWVIVKVVIVIIVVLSCLIGGLFLWIIRLEESLFQAWPKHKKSKDAERFDQIFPKY